MTNAPTNPDTAKILDPVRGNGQPPDVTVWQVSMVTDVVKWYFIDFHNLCKTLPFSALSSERKPQTYRSFYSTFKDSASFCISSLIFCSVVELTFIEHSQTNCDPGQNIYQPWPVLLFTGPEPCKLWCSSRDDCAGFALWLGQCVFKAYTCRNTLGFDLITTTFLKDTAWSDSLLCLRFCWLQLDLIYQNVKQIENNCSKFSMSYTNDTSLPFLFLFQ